MTRFRDLLLTTLSAILLVLPFHFGGLWILAFIAFIPYFFVLQDKSAGRAFKYSYIFGFIFFSLLGYWLNYVNIFGFVILAAYLALYFAFFGLYAAGFLNPESLSERMFIVRNLKAVFFVAALWVFLEYLRGWLLGGLPWALLAYSQWRNPIFIQIADITGSWGVSFCILAINVLLYKIGKTLFTQNDKHLSFPHSPDLLKKYLMALGYFLIGILVLILGYGEFCLQSREAFYKNSDPKAVLHVSVLQGNIPQDQKWDSRIKSIIFEKYKRMTLMAAIERSDLIVWPETSFPGYLEDEAVMAAELRKTVQQSRTEVLVGAPTMGDWEKNLRFYNSAVLYAPNGQEVKRYNKVHLVPFGEYVPLEPVLGLIRHLVSIGHFSPGKEYTIFPVRSRYQKIGISAKFGALICYEDIFPGLVRKLCQNGADFLVNMTNDAWFGKTTAPYQHAQASIFRAVENRVPVVRSTNTGFSCFISSEGRILSSVKEGGQEIMVTGRQGQDIILRKGRSFYTRFGDVFMLIVLFLLVIAFRDRHKQSSYSQL